MHTSTKHRIEFLQKYINRNASRLYKIHSENITGLSIRKKQASKKKKYYYAIVFKVVKKIKEINLDKKHIIPKSIKIKFPDGKTKSVKTDVKQTGEFRFHMNLLDSAGDAPTAAGTIGLFLRDRKGNVFALTNYHVAASVLIRNNQLQYDVLRDPRHDVRIGGFNFPLHIGSLDPAIDAALVFIGFQAPVSNNLPDSIRIDPNIFIDGPLEASDVGQPAGVYLSSRGGRIGRTITDNSSPLNSRLMQFTDLITVRACGRPGDSGGTVLMNRNQMLGVIFGNDDESTYIVPYYKIRSFFPLQIV